MASSTLASAGGALEALRGVGLISHEELTEWNARFWQAVTGAPLPALPAEEAELPPSAPVDRAVTAVAVPVPGGEWPSPPTSRVQTIGFRRLIPGPDEEQAFGPGSLRILALVEYGDGVEVDWLFSLPADAESFAGERDSVAGELAALPPDEQARRLRDRDHHLRWAAVPHDFSLSDDVGTVYEHQGGGAHGGRFTFRGQQRFAPGLPPGTRRVGIRAGEVDFTLTL